MTILTAPPPHAPPHQSGVGFGAGVGAGASFDAGAGVELAQIPLPDVEVVLSKVGDRRLMLVWR